MGITVRTVAGAVARASRCAAAIEQELNAADGRLGDGDTGVTLRRIFERMAQASETEEATELGVFFRAMAATAASASGSSLGTLTAVALNSVAKETKGQAQMGWEELGDTLAVARDAMIARGGAALGDKTVADMLDAVAVAIRGRKNPDELRRTAVEVADATLALFRDRRCRAGRARMYGEKSAGIDDPGMLAFARLLDSVAGRDD